MYEVLGVEKSATNREIKRAYRKRAIELHPDKNPKSQAAEFERKFVELANAYEILADEEKRKKYDANPGFVDGEFDCRQTILAYLLLNCLLSYHRMNVF